MQDTAIPIDGHDEYNLTIGRIRQESIKIFEFMLVSSFSSPDVMHVV